MTLSQVRRLEAGDHVFYQGQLARVDSPPLVRRRCGTRVRVARLAAPDLIVEVAPAELAPFGKLRRMSPANKALLEKLRAIVSRRAS